MLIRSATTKDLQAIVPFSQGKHYFNIPDDPAELQTILEKSEGSFAGTLPPAEREYVFVMEDAGQIVGTSCIIVKHGTPEAPHLYFKIEQVEAYSQSIKSGFIQELLKFEMDENGPTEIGGLVVDPAYRRHPAKIGRQISYVRFNFIKSHRDLFADRVLAEMMGPVDGEGRSLMWERVGRNFVNLSYHEADRLSRRNKEFIMSLFPKYPVYLCMLPAEVREAIGTVQKETEPAVHMLKKIGFDYRQMVDPFDGGPHLWAETDNITLVQRTRKLCYADSLPDGTAAEGLAAFEQAEQFRALSTAYRHSDTAITFDRAAADLLGVGEGDAVWVTEY